MAQLKKENLELKVENDKLLQHHNMRQKLQYHIKIKQENNDLREELKTLRDELSKAAQRRHELEEWCDYVVRLIETERRQSQARTPECVSLCHRILARRPDFFK